VDIIALQKKRLHIRESCSQHGRLKKMARTGQGLPEDGDRIQSPKRYILKKKKTNKNVFLDKDRTMDNVQQNNICNKRNLCVRLAQEVRTLMFYSINFVQKENQDKHFLYILVSKLRIHVCVSQIYHLLSSFLSVSLNIASHVCT
jgi:hypothetical protein